jgi:hypothetical protein
VLDPIELLAAANPVHECPPLPIDVLRTALNDEPSQRDRWTSDRRRMAFGGSALALAAALVALLVIGLGSGPSIVSQAYAATANTGTILRYTSTEQEFSGYISDGKPIQATAPATVSQVWSSGDRWHSIASTPASAGRYIQSTGGTVETVADGHTVLRYSSQRPKIISRFELDGPVCGSALAFELAQGACGDPISELHALLRSKDLKMTGAVLFAGQRVDVLSGSPRSPRTGSVIATITVRILINPTTYQPVQVRSTQLIPNTPSGTGTVLTSSTDVETFSNFQRLKINPRNLSLLNLGPHPGTTTVTRHVS